MRTLIRRRVKSLAVFGVGMALLALLALVAGCGNDASSSSDAGTKPSQMAPDKAAAYSAHMSGASRSGTSSPNSSGPPH